MDLGKCHFQMDHQGDTVQRSQATFLDSHPLNVFEQRIDDLVDTLDALRWQGEVPTLPDEAV
jgi:hypothetical protein